MQVSRTGPCRLARARVLRLLSASSVLGGPVVLLAGILLAGAAGAVPTYSLLYIGPNGSGTLLPTDVIQALPGDVVTVDVLIHIDADGFTGFDFDMLGTSVTALSGLECPEGSSGGSSSNLADGICTTPTLATMAPIQPGVTPSGSAILNFDVGTLSPYDGAPFILFGARSVFQVNGVGSISLVGIAGDGAYGTHTLLPIPEPASAGLLALGVAMLGLRRRR